MRINKATRDKWKRTEMLIKRAENDYLLGIVSPQLNMRIMAGLVSPFSRLHKKDRSLAVETNFIHFESGIVKVRKDSFMEQCLSNSPLNADNK